MNIGYYSLFKYIIKYALKKRMSRLYYNKRGMSNFKIEINKIYCSYSDIKNVVKTNID